MPWTFAHPAAILPFIRVGRFSLPVPALVVGSISPDLGYYIGQFGLATFAHSLLGIFAVCLPLGALILLLFNAVRPALIQLLPDPHRRAIFEAARGIQTAAPAQSAALTAVALIIGAATHTVWDSFTHATGLAVQWLPLLQRPVWGVKVHNVAQHISTLIGVSVLGLAYLRWLRFQKMPAMERVLTQERTRWIVLAGCLMSTCAVGVLAATMAHWNRFHTILLMTDTLVVLVLLASLAWRQWGRA